MYNYLVKQELMRKGKIYQEGDFIESTKPLKWEGFLEEVSFTRKEAKVEVAVKETEAPEAAETPEVTDVAEAKPTKKAKKSKKTASKP